MRLRRGIRYLFYFSLLFFCWSIFGFVGGRSLSWFVEVLVDYLVTCILVFQLAVLVCNPR